MATKESRFFTVDEDSDDGQSETGETGVTLAFSDGMLEEEEEEDSSVNKIGGLPAFSPVLCTPPDVPLICPACQAEMLLLTQIDAPLAADELNGVAASRAGWLRVLYVFACVQRKCHDSGVRIFRALRRINPSKCKSEDATLNPFSPSAILAAGGLGSTIFGSIQDSSREENASIEILEEMRPEQNRRTRKLPAQYLATENEPSDSSATDVDLAQLQIVHDEVGKVRNDFSTENVSLEKGKWQGETYEHQKLESIDEAFSRFQERVFMRAGGELSDQVLRYQRSGTPLPFCARGKAFDQVFDAKHRYTEEKIPPCPKCRRHRTFEMQLMPQLVSKLAETGPLKDEEGELELAWATVWCYLCSGDCIDEERGWIWAEEYAVVQFDEDNAHHSFA